MAKPDVPYAIRNEIATRLAVSHTGFFLDETLKRLKPMVLKPYSSKKGSAILLKFLSEHPRIKLVQLTNDGTTTRYWVYDVTRHEGQAFPNGWFEVVPQAVEEPPKEEKRRKVSAAAPKHAPLDSEVNTSKPAPRTTPVCSLGKVDESVQKTLDVITQVGFKQEPRPEPAPRVYRTRPTEVVPGPFAGLKDLLMPNGDHDGDYDHIERAPEIEQEEVPVLASVTSDGHIEMQVVETSPAPVAQSAIEEEKELTMTANAAAINFANLDPAQLATIGQQLLEASKKAEKQQQLSKTVDEVAKLQLEIAAATAKLERLSEEQLEAVDRLSKASEALRKLMVR